MANRCLLSESVSRFLFLVPPRPSVRAGPMVLRSGRRSTGEDPVDENSCYLTRAPYPGLSPALDVDSIKEGYPRLIPLPRPATIPSLARDRIRSRYQRRYSFKRLVFPVGIRQPQQRHEKRLINKLIRFLSTPRRAQPSFSASFFREPSCPASSCRLAR